MSDYIVTGRTGQNHVTSADHGAANAAFAGTGRYVADGIGETLSAEVITNNLVRIHSGEVINQGRHMRVEANTYIDCTIENGSQSTKRYDLIVFRYTKNADTGMESGQIVVIKGTAGTTAADPSYTKGDILSGAVQDDMPLYRVRINGINIEGVDKLFSTVPSLAALNARVSQLNSDFDGRLTEIEDCYFASGHEMENRNLNDTIFNGVYKTTPESSGSPWSTYGILLVFNTNGIHAASDNSWIMQLWKSTNDADDYIYFRMNINYMGWTNWKKITLVTT